MNATKTIASLTLFTLPLVGFISRGDAVHFHAEEGASVEKTMTFEAAFYMDDMSIVVDGGEISPDMLGGAMDEAIVVNINVSVTDDYGASKDGKIVGLTRSYHSMSLEAGGESDANNVDEFAKLEGLTVAFEWDEDLEEYTKSYVGDEGDEDLLEGLDVDMDLLQLLPSGEVSEGDTWDVSGDGILTVFSPGGMLFSGGDTEDNPEAAEFAEMAQEEIEAQLEQALSEFAIKCTYTGIQKDDDLELAAIEMEFSGEAELDLANLIQSAVELAGEQMGGMEADVSAILAMELEGTGLLLWDMKAGHVHSFTMKNELTVAMDLEGDVEAMGENHSFELALEVSGETALELSTNAGGDDEESKDE